MGPVAEPDIEGVAAGLAPEPQLAPEDMELTVMVGGHPRNPFAPPPACGHRTFVEQVTVAEWRQDDNPAGPVVRRQVKLKARCGECGVPLRFDPSTVALSRTDGPLGLVVDVEPVPE